MKARRAKRSAAARPSGATDLRARLRRAEESLQRAREQAAAAHEQQRATGEILNIISSSPSNVQSVLDAIIRSAVRLGEAQLGTLFHLEGGTIHVGAHFNLNTEADALFRSIFPQPVNDGSPYGRAMLQRAVMNLPDLERHAFSEASRQRARVLGTRAVLAVPMLAKDRVLGALAIGRRAPGAFAEPYVALLKTFADQAVIAIENVRLLNETKEALGQQTAISEILEVISRSPTDVQPVLSAVAERAARLCEAEFVTILMAEGGVLRPTVNSSPSGSDRLPDETVVVRIDRTYIAGRAAVNGQTVHVEDVLPLMDTEFPGTRENQRKIGYRSFLAVPLMRNDKAMGVIAAWRRMVRRFSDKQISLLETFADQAAIAIENVRLFNETREALEQQTATAEILKVIAGSPSDVQPVFDAIIRSASRLAGGCSVNVSRLVGDQLHLAAYTPMNPAADEVLKNAYPVSVDDARPLAEAVRTKRAFFVSDFETDPGVTRKARDVMRARGFRSTLYVPILRGDVVHGVMHVSKVEPGPFPPQWVGLLKTFADQAVIAIENVRLFNETNEALEQQTAISEILRTISGSPGEVMPMLHAVAERAVKLCESGEAGIFLHEGDRLRFAAGCQRGETFRLDETIPVSRGSVLGRALIDRETVHVVDLAAEPVDEFPLAHEYQKRFGHRSIVAVPLMREDRAIGVIGLWRFEVRAFGDKHIGLVRTFADQAAIAIQNVSLFQEIQQKSRQLEVADRHKSEFLANMSHELRTPLNAIIGFTRIVMRRSQERLEPKQYDNLEKILSSGQHLLALINSILDLSKVEAGHVQLNPGEVRLLPVLEQCMRTVEPLVRGDAVSLIRQFSDCLPDAYLDEEKLRQIVINLLSNAAKFTSSGSICVRASAARGAVAIAVEDTGIGIAADKLGLVFEEFVQADASSTRLYGGTGLGLAIARRLARLMGGDVTVESRLGSGSTFTLTLPVRHQAPA